MKRLQRLDPRWRGKKKALSEIKQAVVAGDRRAAHIRVRLCRAEQGGKLLAEGHAERAQVVPDHVMKPRVELAHLVYH